MNEKIKDEWNGVATTFKIYLILVFNAAQIYYICTNMTNITFS
jgi:hypothetical protein